MAKASECFITDTATVQPRKIAADKLQQTVARLADEGTCEVQFPLGR